MKRVAALFALPLLAACVVPPDGAGSSLDNLGGPAAVAPLPPQVQAALPPGVPASVVTRQPDGCYLITIERTNPPSGYPLRDAAGNRVCEGQPVAVASAAPLAAPGLPAPPPPAPVSTAPLDPAGGAVFGAPPVPTAVLGAPPPPAPELPGPPPATPPADTDGTATEGALTEGTAADGDAADGALGVTNPAPVLPPLVEGDITPPAPIVQPDPI